MGKDDKSLPVRKDEGVEMLKFIAAIIIVNSHMGDLYVHYPQLATGGAIGDALFFFCSGFGLALSKKRSFDNYYKRRIGRIYPAIFCWAIITSFLFHREADMKTIVLHGGGWFVTCIMVYYIIFWFIHRYLFNKLKYVIPIVYLISIIWFFIYDNNEFINIYGKSSAKYIFYFGFMLTGSLIGMASKNPRPFPLWRNAVFTVLSILCFYVVLILSDYYRSYWQIQLFSLLPLLCGCCFLYRTCKSERIMLLFNNNIIFGLVGGLCLEIYIVQSALFTTKMNWLFPLNLLIMLVIIVTMAFILRCLSRVFEQLFTKEDFDWNKITSIR